MKKKRGLKRYYRNLTKIDLSDVDFKSEKAWFDLYHIHIDDLGLGNRSWKSRKQHLDALFALAKQVEAELLHYTNDFQYWIEVHEADSYKDAVYIHTKNPNGSVFPSKLEFDLDPPVQNQFLNTYLQAYDYTIRKKILLDENGKQVTVYFLQKDNFGVPL